VRGSWLWDNNYYWDEAVVASKGLYGHAQVIGCAHTYGMVAALMSLSRFALAAAEVTGQRG